MNILIVDGQGGGIGKTLVSKLKALADEYNFKITAVGTNSAATLAMKKAGATESATGENAVIVNSAHADIIAGSIGIIAANSMLGELSPKMAEAIAKSPASKVLIPFNKCNLRIVGITTDSLPNIIDKAVDEIILITKEKTSF
ncbi:MAG: DUF3842 family protein [Lachnospiraceae bacterium]|nr:DUF3842 family protein [Lachnospiraceae bacterium]